MKKTVYLSSSWFIKDTSIRQELKEYIMSLCNVIDPFDSIPLSIDKKMIVERDKELIRDSNILIALTPFPTYGTVMEIMYAHTLGLHVFILDILPEGFKRFQLNGENIQSFDNVWTTVHTSSDQVFTNLYDFKRSFSWFLGM